MTKPGNHIRIDRLSMTGPEKKTVYVDFHDGVNIVWGASNAGKSFIRKSIDYVLGAERFNIPQEGIGYDNFVLWLTTPRTGAVSLRRSIHGGDVYTGRGHVYPVVPGSTGYVGALKATHAPQSPNVSKFILGESGFRPALLLKNERADKSPFSLRTLARYLIVDETRMIDEKSILLAHSPTVTSEDKSLIKFLLTGVDGSSVEQVRSGDQLRAARDGKVELLSGMADRLRQRLDESIADDVLEKRLETASRECTDLLNVLTERQNNLDGLKARWTEIQDSIRQQEAAVADLGTMLMRFDELRNIYVSDADRLAGLEEGAFLFQKFTKMNCPLCGAAPEHQHHDHGLVRVEKQRAAVEAEINKIEHELSQLKIATDEANEEVALRKGYLDAMSDQGAEIREQLDDAAEAETSARALFADASFRLDAIRNEQRDRALLASYENEIQQILARPVNSRQRATNLDLTMDLSTSEANELSKVVKEVLRQWNYPGAEAVHFSSLDQDIVVDGKQRKDNGAGIRAILHSAFKVAVLLYCQEKSRPHPGFMILDAPLLAYRAAEETRFGAVSPEEIELQKADLAGHFYRHLHSLSGKAQFIVIENHKSDEKVVAPYPNHQFTRNSALGRTGFFW